MFNKNKTNGKKPHVKAPMQKIPTLPPYQRPGTVQTITPTGPHSVSVTTKPATPKPATPAKVYKATPKRKDFLVPHDRKPIVQYTAVAWDSMHWLVDNCPIELGWVGAVEQVNRWHYIIHDLRVMEQEATGATFEYEDWNDAVTEMLVKKSMCPGRVDANLGHSHVNMGVNPSGTDEEQMMDLAHFDANDMPTAKFSLQTIVNKDGDHHCAIYDWEHGVHYNKVPHEVLSCLTEAHVADLEMQLKRVKRKTYSYGGAYAGGGYGNGNRGYGTWNTQTQRFDPPTTPAGAPIHSPHQAALGFGFADGSLMDEDPLDPFDNPMSQLWDDEAMEDFESGFDIAQCNIRLTKRLQADINLKGTLK